MTSNQICKGSRRLLLAFLFATSAQAAQTDISTVPLETYSAPSTTDVKPNILFVLDDSGSMDWDFMPDWACVNNSSVQDSNCANIGQTTLSTGMDYEFRNPAYNGVYYNPAINYKAPVAVSAAGVQDTTTYPSQTGAATATGADAAAKPNWNSVKDDAYGVQNTSSSNLTTTRQGRFFTIIPGEYCDSPALRVCQTTATTVYKYPAPIRWCDSAALTNCKAGFDISFGYVRMPSPTLSTITVAGPRNINVSSVTVNGVNIMSSGSTATSNNANTVAAAIVSKINAAFSTNGGFTAYATGAVVTIAAPYPATITFTPAISSSCPSSCSSGSGPMTFTPTAFARQGNNAAERGVPGASLMTVISSDRTAYSYPNTATKAAARTDCSGTTCTYAEEMTNYANWWTYYHTRMQMMKTAASNAFSAIDSAADIAANINSRFRLGYMSINNNTGSDFLNLGQFSGSQKGSWFAKLLAANPANTTPLLPALSTAGRLYGGVLTGTNLNGTTVTDPLQYSCQQNYAILSTDGFWNAGTTAKLNGTTVGNQDAALPRPLNDGGTATLQSRTKVLQQQDTITTYTSTESFLQTTTWQLQIAHSTNSGGSFGVWTNTTSCKWDTSTSTRDKCQYVANTATNTATCTVVAKGTVTTDNTVWNGPATTCAYTGFTALVPNPPTSSCTVIAKSPGPTNYTVGRAVNCSPSTNTGPQTPTTSCTAGTVSAGIVRVCSYGSFTGWSNDATCVAVPPSTGAYPWVGPAKECQVLVTSGTSDTLADVAAYYYGTDLRSSIVADGTGTCVGPVIAPNTTPNDLCANNVPQNPNGRDVATTQHMTTFTLGLGAQGEMVFSPTYWTDTTGDFSDIRAGTTTNTAAGICSWQTSGACNWPAPVSNAMTTIDDLWHAAVTGRGSYFSASDPTSLANGLTVALSSISVVATPGTAAAAATSNPNISTSDNFVFSSSYKSVQWFGELIRKQLDSTGVLSAQQWSAMRLLDCATTPWKAAKSYVVGDVYKNGTSCYYVTAAYTAPATFGGTDTTNTAVMAGAPVSRTIYTKSESANSLVSFLWGSLTPTQQGYFTAPALTFVSATPSGLSQFCPSGVGCLTSAEQSNNTVATGGAAGEALVNFLRGDRTNEGTFYRQRTHVLGDIVSSEARYVKKPLFDYGDAAYGDFKLAKATRVGAVYVASNDGMLHAFDAATGQENWAYIPSTVLPKIYQLADMKYSVQHQFFVDNTPETGDICPNAPGSACSASQWKTILVGGLNRGGKGYYALDVTNPALPALLWEFTDTNLGYSYGNPVITKLQDGTWVVMFSSGYNNADGRGHLYIVNANTGTVISNISNGSGSAGTPSGLGGIAGHAVLPVLDNTTTAVYAGDLQGDLWRFDVNGNIGTAGFEAVKLASFQDASNIAQSIQAQPTVITKDGNTIIFAGTGRFLGTTDVANVQFQSFYAVKDNLGTTTYGNIRTVANGFVRQTLTADTCGSTTASSFCATGQVIRTVSNNAVDWTTKNGWYIDFLTGGERATTNPSLALGTLSFTTITPQTTSANACGADNGSGSSFNYSLDYSTGGAVEGSGGVAGISLGSGLATAPIYARLPDGSVVLLVRVSDPISVPPLVSADPSDPPSDPVRDLILRPPIKPPGASSIRRISWRELPTK